MFKNKLKNVKNSREQESFNGFNRWNVINLVYNYVGICNLYFILKIGQKIPKLQYFFYYDRRSRMSVLLHDIAIQQWHQNNTSYI